MTPADSPFGTHLEVIPDIESAGGFQVYPLLYSQAGRLVKIGLLRHGMRSGRASVGLAIEVPDGIYLIAETSWRNLQAAVRALAAGPVGSEETLDD